MGRGVTGRPTSLFGDVPGPQSWHRLILYDPGCSTNDAFSGAGVARLAPEARAGNLDIMVADCADGCTAPAGRARSVLSGRSVTFVWLAGFRASGVQAAITVVLAMLYAVCLALFVDIHPIF